MSAIDHRNATIAFVSPRFTSPFVIEILSAAEEEAYKSERFRGGILPFSTWNIDEERDRILHSLINEKKADAIVLITTWPVPGYVEACAKNNIPLIVVEYSINGAHSIMNDNFTGGYLAGEYLSKKYGQDTVIVNGLTSHEKGKDIHPAAIDRLKGFKVALSNSGFQPEEIKNINVLAYTRQEGSEIMRSLAREKKMPRSVFCAAGDETAIGIMEAAHKLGLKIPEDLAIMGYDDIEAAGLMKPGLTTIRQPLSEIGKLAFEAASKMAEGTFGEKGVVTVKPELIVRESA